MILVDSNIPMYLVGADDLMKEKCRKLVQQAMVEGEHLVTSVEVYQEILHRYSSIRRLEAIQPAFDALGAIAQEALAVEMPQVERAKEILTAMKSVSAREALHVAVMERHAISRIMSFDAGFDRFPGISRVHTSS